MLLEELDNFLIKKTNIVYCLGCHRRRNAKQERREHCGLEPSDTPEGDITLQFGVQLALTPGMEMEGARFLLYTLQMENKFLMYKVKDMRPG